MNRRQFFSEARWSVMKWSPWLGVIGFRYHAYSAGGCAGWSGWVTWFGRVVAYVPR